MDSGSKSSNDDHRQRSAKGSARSSRREPEPNPNEPADEPSLSADDFRRLGVQPHESRQTVIRQAASRTTKTLARRQLVSPSTRTESQLIKVATSTYRLLDPRNRGDASQRAHVGRIMPNALNWAGQTEFSSGASGEDVSDEPHEQSLTASGVHGISIQPHAPPTGLDLNVPWSGSLDESDLLRRRWFRIRWMRKQLHQPLVLIMLIALLVATSVWVWNLNLKSQGVRVVAKAPSASNELQSQHGEGGPELIEPAQPETPSVSEQEKPTVLSVSSHAGSESGTLDGPPATPIPESPTIDSPDHSARPNTVVDPSLGMVPKDEPQLDDPDELETSRPQADWDQYTMDGYPVELVDVDEAMLPREPAELETELNLLLDQYRLLSEPEQQPLPSGSSAKQLRPVPKRELLDEARRQLESLVPELARERSIKTAELALAALQKVHRSADAGTIDDWTIRLAMAECEWLAGDFDRAQKHLIPISATYDVTVVTLLAESFVGMPSPIESAELHTAVISNGMFLADYLLVAGCPEDCLRVINVLAKSDRFLSDQEVSDDLDDFREAAGVSERLKAKAIEVIAGSPDDVGKAKASIAGRYLCFMTRQWTTGLSWLSRGSDPRFASLASDELGIDKDDPLDKRLQIAKRWLAIAERSEGREADSMRLHAITLLRKQDVAQRGIRQLEAERLIDQAMVDLPEYLLASATAKSEQDSQRKQNASVARQPLSQPVTGKPKPMEATTKPAGQPQPGMLSGQVIGDDQDLGIRIEYQPSMAIGAVLFDEIVKKINRDVFRWKLQLEGEFELQSETRLQFHIAKSIGDMKQELMIDDQVVSFEGDLLTAKQSLNAGKHTVRWKVSAAEIKVIFLAVQDAATGKPIKVQPLPTAAATPAGLTIKIIQSPR